MSRKITRIKNAVTGEEYIVGERGGSGAIEEAVTVELHADGVSWSGRKVAVVDQSLETETYYDLDAEGKCYFSIPNGHVYEVILPTLDAYAQPVVHRYASTREERFIVYEYTTDSRIEILQVTTHSTMTKEEITILDGTKLSVRTNKGEVFEGTFVGAVCRIEIPYGKTYLVTAPMVDGYACDWKDTEYTSSIAVREVVFHYEDVEYGMFGVDERGRMYTIEEINHLSDKRVIKYGYYNDKDLAESTRVDGGTGNGFYWEIGKENLGSMQWATQNVEFDRMRVPFYSDLGVRKYAGMYFTKMIEEVGAEVITTSENPTPAARACLEKTITIAGKTHQGFLGTYDQILKIATTNRTLFQSFYAAVEVPAPTIWSGIWWTSCQYSATGGVRLTNGGFDSGNYGKNGGLSVMVFYDL